MPWNGSAPNQTFGRTDGTRVGDDTWAQAAAAPVNIEAPDHDTHDTDLGNAINACLKKDGGNTATANIPMGGFKLTNLGDGSAASDSCTVGQRAKFADNTGITDDSSNEQLIFQKTASAVNHVEITNAATGNSPSIAAAGDDTNISLTLSGKGTGVVALTSVTTVTAGTSTAGADAVQIRPSDWGSNKPYLFLKKESTADAWSIGLWDGSDNGGTLNLIATSVLVNSAAPYVAGGTDVPVTDGGTGSSSASGARTNLGLVYASASEMETGTATDRVVAPGTQHRHPGHPKAGGNLGSGFTTPAFRTGDYGMGAVTDNGTGDYTMAMDTAFSNTNYWCNAWARGDSADNVMCGARDTGTKTTSSFQILLLDENQTAQDSDEVGITFWGDYA